MFKIGTKGGYGISERGGPGNCQLLERVAFARTCATFFPLFMKFRGLTPPPKKGGGGYYVCTPFDFCWFLCHKIILKLNKHPLFVVGEFVYYKYEMAGKDNICFEVNSRRRSAIHDTLHSHLPMSCTVSCIIRQMIASLTRYIYIHTHTHKSVLCPRF